MALCADEWAQVHQPQGRGRSADMEALLDVCEGVMVLIAVMVIMAIFTQL